MQWTCLARGSRWFRRFATLVAQASPRWQFRGRQCALGFESAPARAAARKVLGAARDSLPIYGSGGFTSYTDRASLQEQLRGWVEEGIARVKMKIGRDLLQI